MDGPIFKMTDIIKQAEDEFTQELFRAAVEKYKEKLHKRNNFWDKIMPWRILIIRKHDAI